MRNLLLVIILIGANLGIGLAQNSRKRARTGSTGRTKPVAVAFFDEGRLRRGALQDFEYFFDLIQQVVDRDFPGVELRILGRGELLHLPDGTRLNVETLQPELGFVLSAKGKKRRVLSGITSEVDFACAAADYFQRSSPACPK